MKSVPILPIRKGVMEAKKKSTIAPRVMALWFRHQRSSRAYARSRASRMGITNLW